MILQDICEYHCVPSCVLVTLRASCLLRVKMSGARRGWTASTTYRGGEEGSTRAGNIFPYRLCKVIICSAVLLLSESRSRCTLHGCKWQCIDVCALSSLRMMHMARITVAMCYSTGPRMRFYIQVHASSAMQCVITRGTIPC